MFFVLMLPTSCEFFKNSQTSQECKRNLLINDLIFSLFGKMQVILFSFLTSITSYIKVEYHLFFSFCLHVCLNGKGFSLNKDTWSSVNYGVYPPGQILILSLLTIIICCPTEISLFNVYPLIPFVIHPPPPIGQTWPIKLNVIASEQRVYSDLQLIILIKRQG